MLESSENSTAGGWLNSTATTFLLGDDAANRQYRAILAFNTAALPDNAKIQSAVLQIKQSGLLVGANPFGILGGLLVDIRAGFFGSSAVLQLSDFNAAATALKVATFNKTPAGLVYSAPLTAVGRVAISRTGATQLRLRFTTDDNNNRAANYMRFLSSNAAGGKPVLVITYTLP